MKILLPVDGSDYTKRMLAYVAAHDELLQGEHEFVFFTAVPPVPVHAARFLEPGVVDGYYREQAQSVLEPVSAFAARHGWNARFIHAAGHAAEAIAQTADAEKPDLIVMGTQGHSAVARALLGSVASGVLARCTVPVLLVR